MAFTTSPQTLTAGVSSNTITVALEDAYGNPVNAGGAMTVNLGTTSSTGTFTPFSPLTLPAGANSVSFKYTDDTAGTPTITAAASGLISAAQQESVSPAAAQLLVFTAGPQTLTAGVASGTMSVALQDAFGNAVDATTPLTVNLSTTSANGTFSPASPLSIPAGANSVSFQYTDTSAGTPVLTVATAGLGPATRQLTVTPAAAQQLAFTSAPQTLTAGVASGTITVKLEDVFGNVANAANALTITLSTTSSTGTFTPISPLTLPAGADSVDFQYTDTTAGTATLTAASSGLASATQPVAVNPAAPDRLVFTTAPQTLTAGVASGTITVALRDAFGNQASAERRIVSQLDDNIGRGNVHAGFAVDHSRWRQLGEFPVHRRLGRSADTDSGRGNLASATQQFTVNPIAASQPGIHHGAADTDRGSRFRHDHRRLGRRRGRSDLDDQCRNGQPDYDIRGGHVPAGHDRDDCRRRRLGELYLYRYQGRDGHAYGVGQRSGVGHATRTVTAAPASQVVFTSAPQTITAGTASGAITIGLADRFGNVATTGSALTVNLSSTSTGGTFTPVSPLTIPAGGGTASFTYTDSNAGTPTLTAAAGGLALGTQQLTVLAGATSSLSGYVYIDANNSGQRLTSTGVAKVGISNVAVTLKRTDAQAADQTVLTQSDGSYQFSSLAAGTYTIVETQPSQYLPGGKDTAGNLGGQGSTNNAISQLVLPAGSTGTEYNFGEWLLAPGGLSKRVTLSSAASKSAAAIVASSTAQQSVNSSATDAILAKTSRWIV